MDESKLYELMDEYRNPPHLGKPKDYDALEEGSSASCGDRFTVYLKLSGGTVKSADFEGSGCVISTVCMSRVCGAISGKTKEQIRSMDIKDVKKLIGIDQISASRISCAMLGLETIKKALADKKRM